MPRLRSALIGALMAFVAGPAFAVPVNNTIDGALWLGGSGDLSVDNTLATNSGVSVTGGTVENDVWFTFIGDGRRVTLRTLNATTFDTQIWAFTGYDGSNLSSLTQIGYDDDGGQGLNARLRLNTVAGTRYWFIVDGFAGATGTAALRYSNLAPVPVPAGGLLLGGVLLAGGAMALRRRRTVQQAQPA